MESIRFVKRNKLYFAYHCDAFLGGIYINEFDSLGLDRPQDTEVYIDVTDDIIQQIRDKVYSRAFNKAVSYAAVSECSQNVIRNKLRLKSFPDDVIDAVIETMYEYNYLNDRRFVESYTRSYIHTKSRQLIERELSDRAIDASSYSDTIDEVYMDENITDDYIIQELLNKKYKNQDLEDQRVKKRAILYLIRHGFTYDKINNHLT